MGKYGTDYIQVDGGDLKYVHKIATCYPILTVTLKTKSVLRTGQNCTHNFTQLYSLLHTIVLITAHNSTHYYTQLTPNDQNSSIPTVTVLHST